MPGDIAQRIERLRDDIRRHDRAYYVLAEPTITDRKYDKLLQELRELEQAYPELVTDDSPTQRVGGAPIEGFRHVTHAIPMLSVDNTYDAHQLREFDARVAKGLGGDPFRYFVDPKIDGVAVSLTYKDGVFKQAATRGDGRTGDDVTHNVRTIRSVPLRLRGRDVPSLLEVRGEVVWPLEDFRRFNAERENAGEPTFANPRNATAGTLKQLDPKKVEGRNLLFVAHGVGRVEPLTGGSGSELFEQLADWGIPASPYGAVMDSMDAIIEKLPDWDRRRHDLPYETDGLVIKVDAFDQRDALGATSKYPRWCIAYKFSAEQAETVILDVDFQVGKQGTITPRAVMEPRLLSGTTVQHASLHNFTRVVYGFDLRVGDTVVVEKAGEIIPQVMDIVSSRPRGKKQVLPPRECPVCRGDVEFDVPRPGYRAYICLNRTCEKWCSTQESRKIPARCRRCNGPVKEMDAMPTLRCINPACPAQVKERLIHFAARNQMDIDGAGQVLIEAVVEKGLVKDYADMYNLHEHRDKLIAIEGMGTKSIDALLAGIKKSKNRPLARLLASLNIRHVGSSTAELLAGHFGSIDALMKATQEELKDIDGIGPELARSIAHFFHSEAGSLVIKRLKSVGVNMNQPKRDRAKDSPLNGKSVVITGTLESMGRKEAQDLVKRHGGSATGSVSKKTDFLVAGESPGTKLDKARRLGVVVLSEKEFLAMLAEA